MLEYLKTCWLDSRASGTSAQSSTRSLLSSSQPQRLSAPRFCLSHAPFTASAIFSAFVGALSSAAFWPSDFSVVWEDGCLVTGASCSGTLMSLISSFLGGPVSAELDCIFVTGFCAAVFFNIGIHSNLSSSKR